jgi:hypothetical protein
MVGNEEKKKVKPSSPARRPPIITLFAQFRGILGFFSFFSSLYQCGDG